MLLERRDITRFQQRLLRWYRRSGRHDLPWRKQPTPYRVLVSEVMLQQTQVNRVIPYFLDFTRRFPSVQGLAEAGTRDLLAVWSGLGYNSRALRLRAAARQILRDHGGRVPRNAALLQTLPGIGPYTAAAVMAFALNQNSACVDTNVRRVLLSVFHLPQDISARALSEVAAAVQPPGQAREWYSALMDYGALVATSKATNIRPLGRQSAFAGSMRELRGNLIRLVVRDLWITSAGAARKLGRRKRDVDKALNALSREGLLRRTGKRYRLE